MFNSEDYTPGVKAAIYWTGDTGAHLISGTLYDKWMALGGPEAPCLNRGSPIAYPTCDEHWTDDQKAICAINFSSGAHMYSSPNGSFVLYGQIYEKWDSLGGFGSFLDWPTSDGSGCGNRGGRYNDSSGGSIYWSPKTGAHEIRGPLPNLIPFNKQFCFDFAASGEAHIKFHNDGPR